MSEVKNTKKPVLPLGPSEEFFASLAKEHVPTPKMNGFNAPKKRITRSSKYTPAVARRVCKRIMEGKSLKEIGEEPGMPSSKTINEWLVSPNGNDFREMYYYARRARAELLIDEIISIADDRSEDWKPTYDKEGNQTGWAPDVDTVARSRLKIETRKWIAAKMLPRLYGDKQVVEHEATGDLAEILKAASNQSQGLPPPIEGKKK